MPSQAQQKAAEEPRRELDFYATRDDFMRAYQPTSEEQRILITAMARAWVRLQKFYDFEAELMETRGLMDLFDNDLDRYKSIARSVAEAERIWRNALTEFQRARRRDNHGRTPMRAPNLNARVQPIRSRPRLTLDFREQDQPDSGPGLTTATEAPTCSSAAIENSSS